jgi:hypothetical protein
LLLIRDILGTDPDPLIRASNKWIRIWILLFSSLTVKTPTKKLGIQVFLLFTFLKVHLHHFSKIKVIKKSQNQGFSYYFYLSQSGAGSGSLHNGSGSKRPRNIRILRIRIRNNGFVDPDPNQQQSFQARIRPFQRENT